MIDRLIPGADILKGIILSLSNWYASWGWIVLSGLSIFVIWLMYYTYTKDAVDEREKIRKWRSMLHRVRKWAKDQGKGIVYDDVVNYCLDQPEFDELRPYLGNYPPSGHRIIHVSQTRMTFDWFEFLEKSIDNLEKQWGLLHKHKRLHWRMRN